ncbi:MAG: DUF1992 domain-containing protein [Pseudomonadota bacterium]
MSNKLAERQILKAQAEGQLTDLPGQGQPLDATPDPDFAQSVGYRIMAEAGAVPEEVRLRKAVEAEARALQALSADPATAPAALKAAQARVADLQMKLSIQEEARRRFQR